MADNHPSVAQFKELFGNIRDELKRKIVGQDVALDQLLVAVFGGGHVLLTGMPGLGRTLMVESLAEVLNLSHRRIQFTPDLLPTDIIGTEVLEHNTADQSRSFRFFKGPVFANLVLADEINRSPARTQAALLEVMQERQVTTGGQTYALPAPFMLIATQNSLESEGVWPLGEAQADRFMFSIHLNYPKVGDEREILARTTAAAATKLRPVASAEAILAMQALVKSVPIVPSARNFALNLVRATRATEPDAPDEIRRSVRLGASPRTAQALLLGAKVLALARGREHASQQDVEYLAGAAMRHRLLLDFRAEASGLGFDAVLKALLKTVRAKELPALSRWTWPLLRRVPV
jgi:MoxR-like ATPase